MEITCPSCKVSFVRHHVHLSRAECQFCGAYFDVSAFRNARVQRRGMSASLPALNNSLTGNQFSQLQQIHYHATSGSDESHHVLGSFLMNSLGRVTMGSLGFSSLFDSERLPPLLRNGETTNNLVQIGSGNTTPELPNIRNPSGASTRLGTPSRDPNYPVEIRIEKAEFLKMFASAKKAKDFSNIKDFYVEAFRSPAHICTMFKTKVCRDGAKQSDPEIDTDFVYAVMDKIDQTPATVQKGMLKSIVACLLNDDCPVYKSDYARALFILIQNPIFLSQSTYTIFAHLLQHVTSLNNADHQLMVNWFRTLEEKRFKSLVRIILQFVTIRQFPPADKSLPPLSKSRWWIPTAIKVLALMNAANNLNVPPVIDFAEFYNVSLDHMDLMQEYYTWQNPDRPGQFSYCQYPFILSIVAKRNILTKDSEQQMILTARRSLIQKMANHQQPHIEIFFLNISVRRDYLVMDSLKEVSEKQKDLKKKLKVSFVGEPGLDMGGLTKEWFQLLIRKIFDPQNEMFVYHPNSRSYWFSISGQDSTTTNLREYNLIGVLMGLAVYNSIILDLHFPSVCYRKLLTPPVVPPSSDPASLEVGVVTKPTIEDLAEIMPVIARSLQDILDYEGDVEEDLMLNFEVSIEEYEKVLTTSLIPGGKSMAVTNANREQFVQLYLEWILNQSVKERFRAFYLGFHSVCASNALIMLRPEEVEQLVCGCPTLDLVELRKVTYYDGYKQEDITIQHFWEVLSNYSDELQKKFLLFTTGSDRVPVGGMGEMTFKITRLRDKIHNLPEAHTCFNQLVLPDYRDKDALQKKLTIAISNAEGFGLE